MADEPVAQTPEQIQAELTADLAGENYVPEPPAAGTEPLAGERQNLPPEPVVKPEVKADAPKYNPIWDAFKEKGGVIPEPVLKGELETGKTEFDYFQDAVKPKAEPQEITDPFVKGYVEAQDKDAYVKNYTEATSLMNMDADDGLSWLYKNQKDDKGERLITDEEITETLKEMSPVKKKMEWQQAKAQMNTIQQQSAETANTKARAEFLTKLPEINKQRETLVAPTLAQIDKMDNVNGVPISQEFKEAFKKDFLALSNIDPEKGVPLINNWLEQDQNVFEAVLAHQILFKDKRVDTFLSTFKEEYKQGILDKTNLNKKDKGGSSPIAVANDPNEYV